MLKDFLLIFLVVGIKTVVEAQICFFPALSNIHLGAGYKLSPAQWCPLDFVRRWIAVRCSLSVCVDKSHGPEKREEEENVRGWLFDLR